MKKKNGLRGDMCLCPPPDTSANGNKDRCGAGMLTGFVREIRTSSGPYMVYEALLPPATKLGQGNIFGSACQEFCSDGGSTHCMLGYTPRSRHPPGSRTPPAADPPRSRPPGAYPLGRHPQAECKLGDTGNKRTEGILLECILVWSEITQPNFATLSTILIRERLISPFIFHRRKNRFRHSDSVKFRCNLE